MLGHAGYRVKLVGRNTTALAELQEEIQNDGGMADYMAADLAQDDQRVRVYEWAAQSAEPLSVLINSAGLAWYGYAEELPWPVASEMLAVNVEAVTRLTSLALPMMKNRREGHIINIGSIAGSIPSQGVALYSATKAFLDAFSTALHRELAGSGVHLSVMRVGAVKTPFFERAARQPNGKQVPAERFAISPETVARRILGLIERPRRVVYVPRILRIIPVIELTFGWIMDRIGPRLLQRD